jgi:hypothetical protein
MGRQLTAAEHQTALSDAAHLIGVTPFDLWIDYFALCGNLTFFDIEAYIYGLAPLPLAERSILDQALWELDPAIHAFTANAALSL